MMNDEHSIWIFNREMMEFLHRQDSTNVRNVSVAIVGSKEQKTEKLKFWTVVTFYWIFFTPHTNSRPSKFDYIFLRHDSPQFVFIALFSTLFKNFNVNLCFTSVKKSINRRQRNEAQQFCMVDKLSLKIVFHSKKEKCFVDFQFDIALAVQCKQWIECDKRDRSNR